MEQTIGTITAEYSEAERAKFTAPLLLIHGLWDQPRSWRPFTSFLTHRGWRCISVGWPAAQRESIAMLTDSLRTLLAQLEEPPILIGQDLGGLLALRLSEDARAAVALAPFVPRPLASQPSRAIEASGSWLERMRGGQRGPGKALRASFPTADQKEPPALLHDLAMAAAEAPGEKQIPRLVVASTEDSFTSPDDARALAAAYGADLEIGSGSHALHVKDGWEEHAGRIHRWLIKSLGQDLLALYEEAWADREET